MLRATKQGSDFIGWTKWLVFASGLNLQEVGNAAQQASVGDYGAAMGRVDNMKIGNGLIRVIGYQVIKSKVGFSDPL